MTAELRWIFLLLHFTAAAARIKVSYVTVRDGDDVTLPCFAGTGDQRRRDDTTWLFSASSSRSVVTVFEHGKFPADVRSKSDRLRVTEKCSLVIEKVSVPDAGLYTCRQNRDGQQEDARVDLSVVTMTEQKVSDDEVTLICSVRSYGGWCDHSVQWLFDDEDKKKETSQFSCPDAVRIKTSEFNQKIKSLRCKVRDHLGNTEKLFEFKTQRSTGGDATIKTTTTTTTPKSAVDLTTKKGQEEEKPPPPQPPTTTAAATTNMMTSEGTKNSVWWVYLLVGVASVFLVVVVVWFLIRQKKKKTSETEPETDQNQVKGHDDDEFTTVIYSTIRAPPPSSSSDPRDLCSMVNKLRRRRMVQ